jgi:hypothetical protein
MKKIKLLAVLLCYMLSFLSVEARRVDVERAEKIARSYAVNSTSQLRTQRDFRLSKTVKKRIARRQTEQSVTSQQPQQQDVPDESDEPLFFVFAANGDKGFIIISGDDVAKPVLGYSDDGIYDENNPNLAYWMETLSQEMSFAIENSFPQDEQIKVKWDALERGQPVGASGDYVDPLVKTKWDQDSPYNDLCPNISGERTVTGCVATAMAQIMKYHEHPTTRTVTVPGYTTDSERIKISAITGSTAYDWNSMTDTYSSSSTAAENKAVATLMYQCGVSMKMDYNTSNNGGSNTYSEDVPEALITYFGYDAGIAYHQRAYNYSYKEWLDLLKTEIKANRPVLYSGSSDDYGHAFVCDGYDINDMFHFNWGWGGSSDGYFEISALNPNSVGIGGGSGGYNQNQSIITGIQPDNGGQPVSIKLGLSAFKASKTSLSRVSESFNVRAENLGNTGIGTIGYVYLGVLLYREDGSYYGHKTARQNLPLPPGYFFTETKTLLSDYSLPSGLPVGTYKLYPAYSLSSEGIPDIIPGENGNRYIIVVVANNGSVTLSGGVETPNLSLVSLKTVGNLYQNTTGFFEVEIINIDTIDYKSKLSIRTGNQTMTEPVVIPAKTTKTIGFSGKITLSPGAYQLSVLYDPDNTGTPDVQLGNAVSVEVKAKPATPNISLASTPSFLNGNSAVPRNAPNLTVSIKNTGGIYQGNVSVDIYQYNTSNCLGSFGSVFVSIDKGETENILYNHPMDLTSGQQYDAYVYVSDVGYIYPKLSFTLAGPVYSSDATLKNLVVKDANTHVSFALSPNFSPSTTSYTAVIDEETAMVSIIGEANSHRARFTNIENAVLNAGENPFDLEVTAEDGTTKMTYSIKITTNTPVSAQTPVITAQPQSATYNTDATATALSVVAHVTDGGTLSYQWYSNTVNSTVGGLAINGATSASHTPSIANQGTVYYYAVVTNTNSSADITGSQTAMATSDVAAITVRVLSNDATLSSLTVNSGTLTPSFDSNTTNYTVNVSNNVTDISVTGTANHAAATVSGNVTDMTLNVGDNNKVNIKVTAENGTTMTYTVRVIRADHVYATEANILSIAANDRELAVNGTNIEYSADCEETSFVLDLQASPYSTVTVDGAEYSAGQSISLVDDVTEVSIRVEAETGGAVTDYTLKIATPLNENRLYFQRWDNVLALNRNPANNGGHSVSKVRWYRQDGTFVSNKNYIVIQKGMASNYYAEIQTGGNWRRVCGVPETRAIDKIIAYPNPVLRGESVYLQLPETFVGGTLDIYDITGSMRKSGLSLPATDNSINVSDLDAGIYLLHITGKNGERQVIKVIVE